VSSVSGAPRRGYPNAESFVTPARRRLAEVVRALNAAVLVAETATDDQLDDAVAAAERAVGALTGTGEDVGGNGWEAATDSTTRDAREHADYLVRSPLLGAVNPLAPPLEYELDGSAVHARGSFGNAYEGPPGYVHGGWVALAFDEVLGTANVAGGTPGLTGRLTVRYRQPTPLGAEVRLDAATASVDGRRITTRGTLTGDGQLTAEAEGLFVTLGPERALEYFGERPTG
jgi:acyl-coenzyme A thioesterase PaaI-like protein